MMPQQIDLAIREMCGDAMSQAVAALADKYGFDAEEANRFLGCSELKLVRKRGPSPKVGPDAKTKKEPKAKKEPKSDDDKPKPKRAKTGYLLYADEVRAETRSALESELEEGEKLKPQDVVRAIAALWKAEDQEVRDEWNTTAKSGPSGDEEESNC